MAERGEAPAAVTGPAQPAESAARDTLNAYLQGAETGPRIEQMVAHDDGALGDLSQAAGPGMWRRRAEEEL